MAEEQRTEKTTSSNRRIQFELLEKRVKDLEVLMQKTGCTTIKECLNNAITLFEWAVEEKGKGNHIGISDRGEFRKLQFPILDRVVKQF